MKKYLATIILTSAFLSAFVAAESKAQTKFIVGDALSQADAEGPFTAVVKADEAQFTLPAPQRPEWKWRRPETRDNAQEYRMDVSIKSGETEYTFGFYLWKRAGSKPGTGSFSELLKAGQRSVFERPASARGFSLIPDMDVKVSERGDTLLITISGRGSVARLFNGKPSNVTFKIVVPGDDPKWKTVPVRYED